MNDVGQFGSVRFHIIKLPVASVNANQLELPHSDRRIAFMLKIDRLFALPVSACQQTQKTFTLNGLCVLIIHLGKVRRSCDFEDCRQDIDDMAGSMKIACRRYAVWPVNNGRCRDSALMNKMLE